jgi:hypothetical protein
VAAPDPGEGGDRPTQPNGAGGRGSGRNGGSASARSHVTFRIGLTLELDENDERYGSDDDELSLDDLFGGGGGGGYGSGSGSGGAGGGGGGSLSLPASVSELGDHWGLMSSQTLEWDEGAVEAAVEAAAAAAFSEASHDGLGDLPGDLGALDLGAG